MNRNFRAKQALPHDLKSPVARQFKSPVCQSKRVCQPSTPEDKKKKIEAIRKKLEEVKTDIDKLEKQGYNAEELQDHIDKLHEYNEIKDVAVMVLGRIATLEGVQTKDMYERYELNLSD